MTQKPSSLFFFVVCCFVTSFQEKIRCETVPTSSAFHRCGAPLIGELRTKQVDLIGYEIGKLILLGLVGIMIELCVIIGNRFQPASKKVECLNMFGEGNRM